LKLLFCGGAGEVGASCYFVQIDGKNILLDCGIRLTSSKDALPDFRLLQESGGIDAIIVSHAHTDHTGALPALSRQFPNALIYMTHMSKDLTRVLLYDSLKIMEREAEIPIYAENHVREMLNRTLCFSPEFTFKPFNDADINITFYSAGHIAGAASIYITGAEGSLFYSGDFCAFRQNTIEGAAIPKLRPDVAIFEATYGDRLHANRQIEEQRLIESINQVIVEGGKVLVPAFALGRAQEIILILKKAINKRKLTSCPVYVDGMVKDICRVYNLNPNYLKSELAKKLFKGTDIFYDDNITAVENPKQRREILESKTPCVIIASSGMLTGGPSQMYAQTLAKDERNLIAITGYQDEESPGRDLLRIMEASETDKNRDKTLKLGDTEVDIKCKVGRFGLSAHADKIEILNLANNLYPRRIFLVHGNPESINSLGKEIQKDINSFVYAPENGEVYTISIKKPRKQKNRAEYPKMDKSKPLDSENVRELWEFITANIGISAALSVEELIEIWGYEQDALEVKRILNESIYFEPDRRRMFLYHAVKKSEIEKLAAPKVMEVNEMLALVDEFFDSETGLYKKGARFDEKIALLYFNFPEIARLKYADKIEEFEKHTGWQVEINKNINTQALNEVIYNLFPKDVLINKISFMPQSRKVRVIIDGELTNNEELHKDFQEITGLSLLINDEDEDNSGDDFLSSKNGQIEQNQALRCIDEAFSKLPHKPYKKSIKLTKSGVKYIELSFISKVIGEQYCDTITKLAKETGYTIKLSDSCNQTEIINIAKRLAFEKGLKLKKNPSIFLDNMLVQIVLNQDIDDAVKAEIQSRFLALTGMTLEII